MRAAFVLHLIRHMAMEILTAAEMREVDRITIERFGVASAELMTRAGTAVARFVVEQFPEARRVVTICGKGNNGGDGLMAASVLAQGGARRMFFCFAGGTS